MDTNDKNLLEIPAIRITEVDLEKRFGHPEVSKRLKEVLSSKTVESMKEEVEKKLKITREAFQVGDIGFGKEDDIRINFMTYCLYTALNDLADGKEDDIISALLKVLTVETAEKVLTNIMLQTGYLIGKYTQLIDNLGKETADQLVETFGIEIALEISDQLIAVFQSPEMFCFDDDSSMRHDN